LHLHENRVILAFEMAHPSMPSLAVPRNRQVQVLTKATLKAAEQLAMNQQELASVLGVSAATLSRTRSTGRTFVGKEIELAGHFVRLYRSLDSLMGGDQDACRQWLRAENTHLGGVPADLMKTIGGLLDVGQYLDAMRGKV
jgi:uncharacterized protein (DUF2384 family)